MKRCNEFEKPKKFEIEKLTIRIIVCINSIIMHFILVIEYRVRFQSQCELKIPILSRTSFLTLNNHSNYTSISQQMIG